MLSAPEQFFLEQLNRARLNPAGEAERFGIGLNDPDPTKDSGQTPAHPIAGGVRQPLAGNEHLSSAALVHSQAYLDGQVQMSGPNAGHHWLDGTTPADRAEDAGYGSRNVGENLAFGATTAAFSAEQAVLQGPAGNGHHKSLFYSITHRPNLLNGDYKEAGIAQVFADDHISGGVTFNASVITNKFGTDQAADRFLTGAAYDDDDGDGFYSLGEGRGGVTITALGTSTITAGAGGYALNLGAQANPVEVAINWQGQSLRAAVDISASNVKLDIVGGSRILASGNLTLLDGVAEGGLLGAGDLALTGNALDNLLLVGRGNNVIDGAGGVNTAQFTGAFADYAITGENGTITVSDQRGSALGDGVNTLQNIGFLQFADGIYTANGALAATVAQGQITLDAPAIGAFMSAQDQRQDLVVTGSTQDLPNGTQIMVTLNNKVYETRTESGQWSVVIPAGRQTQSGYVAGDLDLLTNSTEYQITAQALSPAGPIAAEFGFFTIFTPPALGDFTAYPFGSALGTQDLMEGVSAAGTTTATGGTLTLTLNGIDHHSAITPTGLWTVLFPGSTLATLTDGQDYPLALSIIDQAGNRVSGSFSPFTANLNFLPPALGFDLPFDGPLTPAIRDAELVVSGSATNVPDDVAVTVQLNGQTYSAPVQGGQWQAKIPAQDLATLPDGATFALRAEVAVSSQTASTEASFQTQFTSADPAPDSFQLDLILQNPDDTPLPQGTQARITLAGSDEALGPHMVDANGAVQFTLPQGAEGALHVTRAYQSGTDESITALDALDVLRIAVGLNPSFGPASAQNFIAADINGDNAVTALDALEVLRAAVGLPSEHAPRWVFFDAETDFSAMQLDRTNSFAEAGVELATLTTGQPLAMTGILLGNMELVA
ncbi:MAG: dockerin type I domain-containing protein [Roseinatronobacter sp.]